MNVTNEFASCYAKIVERLRLITLWRTKAHVS